ncbi:MAG: low molecular weight phosphotyrosine protein phosphatase [Chitinophagaceae bacterium]|nr:low molecular weight phosphotyrosine protein phosphatase [Chitinophagaceae bacterium]
MKILFVCLGNICRSPIADGVMRHLVKVENLPWTIDSAGTESFHVGEAPHQHSQSVCLEKGIDISGLRARKFTHSDIDHFDRVYAMSADVFQEIKEISGKKYDPAKVELFLNELYPGQNLSVKDPWYGEREGYYEVFDQISLGCETILKKYRNKV